jgi:hypothetical protein
VSALSACGLSEEGKMHLRLIRPSVVTGVICGWNVPDEEVRSLAADLCSVNPDLEVYVASFDRGHVGLMSA